MPQSTVDFLGNWAVARELRRQGKVWENPYDLGCTSNWQVGMEHGPPRWCNAAFFLISIFTNNDMLIVRRYRMHLPCAAGGL